VVVDMVELLLVAQAVEQDTRKVEVVQATVVKVIQVDMPTDFQVAVVYLLEFLVPPGQLQHPGLQSLGFSAAALCAAAAICSLAQLQVTGSPG
jgi:hypothetical protein